MSSDRQLLRARWVFPGDSEPFENGTLEIEDGRIQALHRRPDPAARDLGNVALVPGLVNAHTHLEFSGLSEPLRPAAPFSAWIREVIAHRQAGSDKSAAIVRGFRESGQSGSTTLGEIATDDWPADLVSKSGPRAVVFREIRGLLPEQAAGQLLIAKRHLAGRPGGSKMIPALSPHAPYSVGFELFGKLVALAAESGAPLAMHLAETQAELELLERGTGELVELLRGLGVWRNGLFADRLKPLDYLRELSKAPRALVVHGNYLSPEEIAYIGKHPNLTVVYCPRTHAFFGHQGHPWRALVAQGGHVAIGTDSRASNPDLSLWKELQFLSQNDPEIDGRLLLKLGTMHGARALGLDAMTGSLTPGKSADVAVVALPAASAAAPYELLFDSRTRVIGTLCAGQWVDCNSAGSG